MEPIPLVTVVQTDDLKMNKQTPSPSGNVSRGGLADKVKINVVRKSESEEKEP